MAGTTFDMVQHKRSTQHQYGKGFITESSVDPWLTSSPGVFDNRANAFGKMVNKFISKATDGDTLIVTTTEYLAGEGQKVVGLTFDGELINNLPAFSYQSLLEETEYVEAIESQGQYISDPSNITFKRTMSKDDMVEAVLMIEKEEFSDSHWKDIMAAFNKGLGNAELDSKLGIYFPWDVSGDYWAHMDRNNLYDAMK